jgi:hypothetical protein
MNTKTAAKEVIDLFLCHNGADKDWVRNLAEQLESETFDGSDDGRNLRVFLDEWDIDVGQNVVLRLDQALSASRHVAVIISPEMLNAPWPTLEWTHIVAEDPTNRKGRIIPIYLRDYSEALNQQAELPLPFKALNWIDFRRSTDFKRSFQKLIRKVRNQPPTRGRKRRPIAANPTRTTLHKPSEESSAVPDKVSEYLLSNLLPVEDHPETIWFAPTDARKNSEVYKYVDSPCPFILENSELFTFADLSDECEPLRAVIDETKIRSESIAEWKDDPVRWRWIIQLLNQCLRSHFAGLPVKKDRKGRFFFRPKDGKKRVWKNGSDPERTVADIKTNSLGDTFWVHHAARLKFQTLGESLFIQVEPNYVFTSDGNEPLEGKSVGPLSIKWGGKERNAAIVRHVAFWGRTLTKQTAKIEVSTGAKPVVVSALPGLSKSNFGIEFDQIGIGSLIQQAEDELALAAETVTRAPDLENENDH